MPTFTVTTNMRRTTENGASTDMPLCSIISADTAEDALKFFAQAFYQSASFAEGWKFIGLCRATVVYEDEYNHHRQFVTKRPASRVFLTVVTSQ